MKESGGRRDREQRADRPGPRILIIVQNLPVPFDRRVWLECQALIAAGYEVTVVCPKGKGDPGHEVIDGVTLLQVPRRTRPVAGRSASSWSTRTRSWRRQAGAPRSSCGQVRGAAGVQPTGHLLAHRPVAPAPRRLAVCLRSPRPLPRALRLALSRTGAGCHGGDCSRWREATFRTADHVISTNASYAEVALRRGGKVAHRRDGGAHRAGRGSSARRAAPVPALPTRSAAPRRLHRRHGSAGRRRPGCPGGRARGPRAGADRRLLHLHGRRRQLRRPRRVA